MHDYRDNRGISAPRDRTPESTRRCASRFVMTDKKRLRKPGASTRRAESAALAEHAPAMPGLPDDIAPDTNLPGVDVFGQELVRECPHCGTGVQLEVDLCPICGSRLGPPDGGLVGLFDGMEFRDEDREIDCPLCGEHVVLVDGACPACNEPVAADGRKEDPSAVEPLLHGHDILLMRLDVESGEVSYLQRAKDGEGWDQVTVPVTGERHPHGKR